LVVELGYFCCLCEFGVKRSGNRRCLFSLLIVHLVVELGYFCCLCEFGVKRSGNRRCLAQGA